MAAGQRMGRSIRKAINAIILLSTDVRSVQYSGQQEKGIQCSFSATTSNVVPKFRYGHVEPGPGNLRQQEEKESSNHNQDPSRTKSHTTTSHTDDPLTTTFRMGMIWGSGWPALCRPEKYYYFVRPSTMASTSGAKGPTSLPSFLPHQKQWTQLVQLKRSVPTVPGARSLSTVRPVVCYSVAIVDIPICFAFWPYTHTHTHTIRGLNDTNRYRWPLGPWTRTLYVPTVHVHSMGHRQN